MIYKIKWVVELWASSIFIFLASGCAHSIKSEAVLNSNTQTKPYDQKIIFVSQRAKDQAIHSMNLDGSNQNYLTPIKISTYEARPKLSINHEYIVYLSRDINRKGIYEICLFSINDKKNTRITTNSDIESDIQFNPDNSRILYSFMDSFDAPSDIAIMNVNGKNIVNLTNTHDANEVEPAFSPEGTNIAYASNDSVSEKKNIKVPGGYIDTSLTRPHAIFIKDINNGMVKRLTSYGVGNCREPVYNPNGKSIMFVTKKRIQKKMEYSVCSINIDGSSFNTIFASPLTISSPKYSLDGKYVIFTIIEEDKSGMPSSHSLYIMGNDGKNLKRLVKDEKQNQTDAVFTSDNKKIIFTSWLSHANAQTDICIIDINGSNFVNLTKDTGGGSQPDVR